MKNEQLRNRNLSARSAGLLVLSVFLVSGLFAQDNRAQYPLMLRNSYFEINIGYINYPFTDEHLDPGYEAEYILIPHTAVRIIPYGYHINKYLSAQISYMRPVLWVRYANVNGDGGNHAVYMNVGGATLKGQLPIGEKFSVYGEAGLGVITRKGFHLSLDPKPRIMQNTVYASTLLGGGLKFKPNPQWDFMLSAVFSPANANQKQPYTIFYSGGFAFNMRPLPDKTVERNASTPYVFPHNTIQVGYSTNAAGYGVNNFLSQGKVPVFWGGEAEIASGYTIMYHRNAFHTYRTFELDWGASLSYWVSNVDSDKFWTLSVFPVLRFNLVRTRYADLYFNYSVAGPTYISGLKIDGALTGPHFTFQDYMGIGGYFGPGKRIVADIRIAHYSNGNLSPENEGVKIPLTFSLGYTFSDRSQR